MNVSDDKKFESLTEHYENTFTHIISYIKRRDRLFLVMLTVSVVMVSQLLSGDNIYTEISKGINAKWKIQIGVPFIRVIMWLLLLISSLKYCQSVITVEQNYKYIHKLEKEISPIFESKIPFTREGKSYLANYPKVSTWADWFYVKFIPIMIIGGCIVKIVSEFEQTPIWIFNIVLCITTITLQAYYFFYRLRS